MTKFALGLFCGVLSSSAQVLAQAQAPAPTSTVVTATTDPEASLFGMRESATHMDLSPSGKQVAFIAPAPNSGTVAFTAELGSGEIKPFLASAKSGERLSWCRFVTDERLICRYGVTLPLEGDLIQFSRMVAVNRDGSGLKPLGQTDSERDSRLRQFDGEIIDWLPGQRGAVLMARNFIPENEKVGSRISRRKEGLGVTRIDTTTLKAVEVEQPRSEAASYMSDGRGAVRLMAVEEYAGETLTGRVRYQYRTSGDRNWRALSDYAEPESFVPLAIDASLDSLYVLKSLNGRAALYRMSLGASPALSLVASNPRVDIDQVVRSSNGERVIGYSFAEEKRRTILFDPDYEALHSTVAGALSKLPIVDFVGASADGGKLLVFAGADNDPGRYFLFDRKTKRLGEIIPARPELEKQVLASVRPVTIGLADGTRMPAYLTMPPGKAAKGLPAIVLPHGGPSSRDEWGFDWLAQYLAARGYAVLQPNYRGSAGFGDEWLVENGFKSWQVSIGDIAASARWLTSEGIADPNRVAIVGWSYGGYAALQAAATEPGLFKAVAAIAPVTDLDLLKEEARNYTNSELVAQFVGSGPHIVEGSPLQRAGSIKVPVLLAHGDMDVNVGVSHSAKMNTALRAGGTRVQLLRYKTLDHQLDDSAARKEILTAIGKLLEETIGR